MGKNQDPSRIRDKHPGSATLFKSIVSAFCDDQAVSESHHEAVGRSLQPRFCAALPTEVTVNDYSKSLKLLQCILYIVNKLFKRKLF
jgi:hypothetical protein